MVKVKIDVNNLEIMVEGHANTAPAGYDLVCCAVSILLETLSVYLERQLTEGRISDLHEENQPGHVYINPVPYGWSREETETAFCVIREGLRALAEQYSEYIKLEEE